MNGLDLVLVLAAIAAAVGGWTLGFIRRLGGWLGVALGLTLGVVSLPSLINALGFADDRVIFIFGGVFLVLLATVGQGLGESVGSRIRSGVDTSGGRYLDSLGGSVLGLLGVAILTWLVFPLMSGAQGWPSQTARSSTIARGLSEFLPPPPAQIGSIERALTGGGFPRLFDQIRPAPEIEPPPPDVDIVAETYRRSVESVVRVESPACGRIQTGSGFFAGDHRVVTNAHVVAGAERTTVISTRGEEKPATVVHFDPAIDLAILAVDSDAPPLPLAEGAAGDQGLVMGFPGGGPFDPSPFAIAERVEARGFDIYDQNRVTRSLLILASDLQPGDSGSAVLRTDGTVVGVAVAIAPDKPSVAYALDSKELSAVIQHADGSPTSTGPCR